MTFFGQHSWLRRYRLTLIALFAFSMMSLLALEQSRVIERQRSLIQDLYRDSLELSVTRMARTQADGRR